MSDPVIPAARTSSAGRFLLAPKRIRRSAGTALFVVAMFVAQGCQAGPPPPPRDYFFSPRGSDAAGDGSAGKPFQSVAKANELRFNPGDRVLFEGGQSFDGNLTLTDEDAGTAAQPVTVGSHGAGRATILAGAGTGVRVENAGGVRVTDLVVVGAGAAANGGSGVEFVNTLDGHRTLNFVRVENVDARGFGKEGVYVHGAPDDRSPSGYADVAIADCVAKANKHTGIYVTGCWAANWGEQPHAFAHRDVRVVRCLAADNAGDPASRNENRSGSGILLDSVDGGLIEHCEATNNGSANQSKHGGPVGIWCTISNKVAIRHCKSHRNRTGAGHDGGGFCLDGGVCNSVLQYNLSEENEGSGFGLYEYPGAPPAFGNVVRHNVSRNDGRKNGYAGIHVWDDARTLRDVKIHDNQVYMAAATDGGGKRPRVLWLQSAVRDAEVANNTFVLTAGVRLMDVAWGQRRVRFENNVYRPAGDAVALEWQGREFGSLAEWLRATGEPQPAGGGRADTKE